jgi:IS4 transposase
MILREVMERMERRAPIAAMLRGLLENLFSPRRLNALFESAAETQSNKKLLFSTVADIVGLVALRIQPSVHAAYQGRKKVIGVTAKALYDKLQRTEPQVGQALLRYSAKHLGQIVAQLPGGEQVLVPGYRVKILDGNHLRRTDRRLAELRTLNAAPLPGHCAVVLDPQAGLMSDVFPCEDGHAQERTLIPTILESVAARDLWIADRNFCTTGFLWGLLERKACFVIRQHASLCCELVGKRKFLGRCKTGKVFEQQVRLLAADGHSKLIRRVTIELDQPTRNKETEIHILTNLPAKITAFRVAELYRGRWTIETAFQEVAENLEGEIKTLGYPRAALFAFCMALVGFNLVSVIRTAIRVAHQTEQTKDELSSYYLCDEIAHAYRGLDLTLDDADWTKAYAELTPRQLARKLLRIAKGVNLSRYRKHPRGPKKPSPKMNKRKRNHVSTARILSENTGYKIKALC